MAPQYVEHHDIQQAVSAAVEKELAKREKGGLSWNWVCVIVLLALMLMCLAFYLGYKMGQGSAPEKPKTEMAAKPAPQDKPKAESAPVAKPQAQPAPVAKKKEPTVMELAAKYPQLEGGTYWIVGTRSEHEVKVGDNLYALAFKEYGDKALARYIIFHNGIKDPDKILLGSKLRLPELVKKD